MTFLTSRGRGHICRYLLPIFPSSSQVAEDVADSLRCMAGGFGTATSTTCKIADQSHEHSRALQKFSKLSPSLAGKGAHILLPQKAKG